MRLRNDDELGAVNNEYIGPPGQEWPRARYIAYVIGPVVLILLLMIEHRIGLRLSVIQGLYTLTATVLLTRTIGKWITPETPFRVLPSVFWHELTAPRPLTYRHAAVLSPARVPVRDTLPARWWRYA